MSYLSFFSTVIVLVLTGAQAQAQDQGCLSRFEKETSRLINLERQKAGLKPLKRDLRLVEAARHHAEDMGTECFLSHEGSDGSLPSERTEEFGYPKYHGEIIAMGYSTPEEVVANWMDSPPHKKIILTREHLQLGGTHYYNPQCKYEHYWAFVFGAAPATESPKAQCDEPQN